MIIKLLNMEGILPDLQHLSLPDPYGGGDPRITPACTCPCHCLRLQDEEGKDHLYVIYHVKPHTVYEVEADGRCHHR